MSAAHTPGRIATAIDSGQWSASHDGLGGTCYQALVDDSSTVIALVVAHHTSTWREPDTRPNARRLAACWNACEGLSTEALENIALVGDTLAGRFAATHQELIKAAAELLRLERQRDELLAALREAREALQMANDTPGGPIADTIWMMHRPETLFDFIDAAINRATEPR